MALADWMPKELTGNGGAFVPAKTIIDEQLPRYDVTLAAHRVVAAAPPTTLRAARELDFLTSLGCPMVEPPQWMLRT